MGQDRTRPTNTAAPFSIHRHLTPGAFAAVVGLLKFHPTEVISMSASIFVAAALAVSATIAIVAIGRGGLPDAAGAPPDPKRLARRLWGILPLEWAVYLGAIVVAPCFLLLVSGGAPLRADNQPWSFIQKETIDSLNEKDNFFLRFDVRELNADFITDGAGQGSVG